MNSLSDIRNQVIDKLLAIGNREYLMALSKMIDSSNIEMPAVQLSEEQKLMLAMSDEDITGGKIIEQSVLHEQELQWLKGK